MGPAKSWIICQSPSREACDGHHPLPVPCGEGGSVKNSFFAKGIIYIMSFKRQQTIVSWDFK